MSHHATSRYCHCRRPDWRFYRRRDAGARGYDVLVVDPHPTYPPDFSLAKSSTVARSKFSSAPGWRCRPESRDARSFAVDARLRHLVEKREARSAAFSTTIW